MSTLSLRLPESLHKSAKKLAKEESYSINQLIVNALSEKLASIMTEKYLEERATKGDLKKYRKVLAKVPSSDVPDADKV